MQFMRENTDRRHSSENRGIEKEASYRSSFSDTIPPRLFRIAFHFFSSRVLKWLGNRRPYRYQNGFCHLPRG